MMQSFRRRVPKRVPIRSTIAAGPDGLLVLIDKFLYNIGAYPKARVFCAFVKAVPRGDFHREGTGCDQSDTTRQAANHVAATFRACGHRNPIKGKLGKVVLDIEWQTRG
eukprot:15358006-Ditylum_brightwellii.AAC.1